MQEGTCEQRLRSQVQGVCENPQQNQCLFQTVALEQMLPILGEKGDGNKTIALEKREMAIKPHQHRRQESKYGLNPSGKSYSRGLRVVSPCSDSAALSHLPSSRSRGRLRRDPCAISADAVGAAESWALGTALLNLCPMPLLKTRGVLESNFITAP